MRQSVICSEEYKAGVRKFPLLVPITPNNVESENNRQAWLSLHQFEKPFLTAFSDSDPVTRGAELITAAIEFYKVNNNKEN